MTEPADAMMKEPASTADYGSITPEKGLFTVALICPSCGAGVSFLEGSTKVVCDHCGLAHMVTGDKGLSRYIIRNRKRDGEAAELVRRFLVRSDMYSSKQGVLRLIDARLVYVPFYRIKVTGGGWYIGQTTEQEVTWTQTGNQEEVSVVREVKKQVVEGFFKDLVYFTPAVDVSDMGLVGIWAKSMILELIPFGPDSVVDGEVWTAVKVHDAASREAWATLTASAKPAAMSLDYFEAEKVSERISMIHYPIWIVRFLTNGLPRHVVVDGVGGDVIFAHIPVRRRLRTIPGILILALVAVLLTTFPPAFIIGAVAVFVLIVFKGWDWFLLALDRLFIRPWRSEDLIIG